MTKCMTVAQNTIYIILFVLSCLPLHAEKPTEKTIINQIRKYSTLSPDLQYHKDHLAKHVLKLEYNYQQNVNSNDLKLSTSKLKEKNASINVTPIKKNYDISFNCNYKQRKIALSSSSKSCLNTNQINKNGNNIDLINKKNKQRIDVHIILSIIVLTCLFLLRLRVIKKNQEK